MSRLVHAARVWLMLVCVLLLLVFTVLCARWVCVARDVALPFGLVVFAVLAVQHIAERRCQQ